jgi:phage baseplate assembly protein gpV
MNVQGEKLDVDGNLVVNGDATIDDNLTVGGTLTVNGGDITFGSVHLQQTSTQLSMKLNDTDWMLCNNSNNQLQLYRKLIATKDIYVKNNIEFDGLFISKDGEYLKFSKGIKVNNDVEVGGKLTVEGEEFSVNNFYVHAIGTDYVDFSVGAAMFLDYNLTDHILHTGAKFTTVHAEIYNSLKVHKDVNILGTLTANELVVSSGTITVDDLCFKNNWKIDNTVDTEIRVYSTNGDDNELFLTIEKTGERIWTEWLVQMQGGFISQGMSTFNNDVYIVGKLYLNGAEITGNQTINHKTNVFSDDIGCFCESTGEIYDGYKEITYTDCICKVKQSHGLNKKIVGIITGENTFASHGDVLVKLAAGCAPEVGDILCPDEDGYGKVASDSELMFMMMNAIPRPKITSLNVGVEGYAACFIC